ncbi:MAG TPA: glycosyltransferase family 4 protein [Hyphomicrobium sp.]|nr:glycosyltransferase family 4 protein [Rhizomicrobium sp.]HVX35789.1 glycosyltransferase family 4 protein [Hyphomicrobium sp.]
MLSDLAFGLAERNVQVTVITSRLAYATNAAENASFETIKGVDVHRIWTTRFGRSHLARRSIDYLTFYVSVVATLLRIASRGDAIVAMTDPPMLSILAAPVAKLRGAILMTWLQDMFPEIAEVLGIGGRLGKFFFSALRNLRDISLRNAGANIAIGELMARRLTHAHIASSRIHIISNWADTNEVTPVSTGNNKLRSRWNLADHFVVGYSGNLGRAHDIEILLNAIAEIEAGATRTDSRSIRWLFIGGGHGLDNMKKEVARRNLHSVLFRPYQPREQLSQSLSVADAHLVTLKPELEGLIVPSKFYGIAAAGRPTIFIGAENGEIAHLLDRHQCGLTIPDGDSTALAQAVRLLANNPTRAHEMGRRARTACATYYSKTAAIDAWARILRENSGIESSLIPETLPNYGT